MNEMLLECIRPRIRQIVPALSDSNAGPVLLFQAPLCKVHVVFTVSLQAQTRVFLFIEWLVFLVDLRVSRLFETRMAG